MTNFKAQLKDSTKALSLFCTSAVSPQAPLCVVPLWTTASRKAGKHLEWNAASQDYEPNQVSERRDSPAARRRSLSTPGSIPSLQVLGADVIRPPPSSIQACIGHSLHTQHVLLMPPLKDSWEVGLSTVKVTKVKVDTKEDGPSAPCPFGDNWSLSGKRL